MFPRRTPQSGAEISETSTPSPARIGPDIPRTRSPLHHQFVRGEASAVAAGTSLVSRVVRFRGYYVPHHDRPDLIQETLVDVIRETRRRAFDSDEEFLGFVKTVAYRRCVDWVRKRRSNAHLRVNLAAVPTPADELLERERQRLGVRVVRRMQEKCRTLFALHAGMGMTYGEISEVLGRSEGALRTQMYECLKAAKKMAERVAYRGGREAAGDSA